MVKVGDFQLLRARPGTCQVCATDHPPEFPHNQQSMHYHYWFLGAHGRWPTWADAVAHCSPQMQEYWKQEVPAQGGKWTEPEGEPIADPINADGELLEGSGDST